MKKKPTEEQKQKAAERRERFKALWKQVAAMPEEERVAKANELGIINCNGNMLSPRNMMLLMLQRSNVTVVGGFRQWLKMGRVVRKGEHGLMIWVPAFTSGEANPEPAEQKDGETEAQPDRRFIVGTVFDISQTDERTAEPEAELVSDDELLAALV